MVSEERNQMQSITIVPQGGMSTGRILRVSAYEVARGVQEMTELGVTPSVFDAAPWEQVRADGLHGPGDAFCNKGQQAVAKEFVLPYTAINPTTKLLRSRHLLMNVWPASKAHVFEGMMCESYIMALQHAYFTNASLDDQGRFIYPLDPANFFLALAVGGCDNTGTNANYYEAFVANRAANLEAAAALKDGTPYYAWMVPLQCLTFQGELPFNNQS